MDGGFEVSHEDGRDQSATLYRRVSRTMLDRFESATIVAGGPARIPS